MKLVVALCLLGLALGHPANYEETLHTAFNYHENIGIKEAALIKAGEESTDFDGSRIVGGSNANLGQYPFLGGLIITLTTGQTSVCGSSLISNNRAVTAAHCWFDGRNQARQLVVALGTVTLFSGGTRVTSSSVVMHPNWNPARVQNDVAVINLSWITFNNNIRSINLASGSNDFAGSWANAAGYGSQRDGQGIANNQRMHHVSLQVITNTVCARTFLTLITSSIICTSGANGRSTCGGDSGGPLVNNNNLIGITSFGHSSGCQRGHPAAFARVTAFRDWIRGRM